MNINLKKINPQNIEDYTNLCRVAIDENNENLKNIQPKFLDKKIYFELCKKALKNNSYLNCQIFAFVKPEFLDKEDYSYLCKNSINGHYFSSIDPKYLDKEVYTDLCIRAANVEYFEFINPKYLDKETYTDLCVIAIGKKGPCGFQFFEDVRKEYLDGDVYNKITIFTINTVKEYIDKTNRKMLFINYDFDNIRRTLYDEKSIEILKKIIKDVIYDIYEYDSDEEYLSDTDFNKESLSDDELLELKIMMNLI